MREDRFIEYIEKIFSVRDKKNISTVIKGIGDDCAVLRYTSDKYLLVTCDMIAEGTHFSTATPPVKIGWKAMAVNISDIASMGGIPKYGFVSIGVSATKSTLYLKHLTKGIKKISDRFGISILGGDTNRSFRTVVNITLIGEVKKKHLTKRDGAETEDFIFVTGTLGEGKTKHLDFLPRLKEAGILVKNFRINSMIDLSDGLCMDLNRLAKASGVGARVYKSLIPVSERARSVNAAISSGEDFELLFTASGKEAKNIIKYTGKKDDLPITLIGKIVDRSAGIRIIDEEGRGKPLGRTGYRHF